MDLKDQLQQLFPDHEPQANDSEEKQSASDYLIQNDPIVCKYEKRKGKPITLLEEYTGTKEDFKKLAKELKTLLGVGGSVKGNTIIIQGDYRNQIMEYLKDKGFSVKRVGG